MDTQHHTTHSHDVISTTKTHRTRVHRFADVLLHRTMSYSKVNFNYKKESEHMSWLNRHRDTPAVFRKAIDFHDKSQQIDKLFTTTQVKGIKKMFPSRWKENKDSPILKLIGTMRKSSSYAADIDMNSANEFKVSHTTLIIIAP